ncbi:hypothetical protein BC937DRAFT_87701 [Endogone sp. FLAS-F59071]|nr:hypothetical protein BC937DRAFT_87701 [Endogone sp. FLAS-F59071]|eukprot:RUS19304.1 hypothetical protein BC937DRAFT_87701 [Endogone sp. FLAS-F59071]
MVRVVSLLPSAAEIICLVAGPEVLVDDYPGTITHLPILTRAKTVFTDSEDVNRQVSESLAQGNSLYDLDVEQLKALKPDVIVTQAFLIELLLLRHTHRYIGCTLGRQDLCDVCSIDLVTVERVAKTMSPAPKVVTLNPQSLSDVLESITLVGSALSLGDAAARARADLQARIDAACSTASEALAKREGKRPAVAFAEWIDPFFMGGHWTPQLIELAGGAHPLNPSKDSTGAGKSFAIPFSRVIAKPINVLIVCPCGLDIPTTERELEVLVNKAHDKGEPCWWEVVKEGCAKVAIVDGNQMFNRPGPRLVDALEWLTGLINNVPEIIPHDFPYKLAGENADGESAMLVREMKSLDVELAWLLTVDLPLTLVNVCTELTRCVKASSSGTQDLNAKPSALGLSSANNDSLKGYIDIHGSQIVKGVIDILLKYVNQARSELNHASEEKLFPLKARDNKLFNPELPEDLIVEFFISEIFVICKVSALQYHANVPIASAVAKFSLLGGPKPANKMVKYKGQNAVVIDEVKVDSKSPVLVDMLAALKSVEDACRQFRTKLNLFL